MSGLSGQIADVNVTLNLAGGWNGDLYAYLAHGSGFAVLLNRVDLGTGNPFGYSDAGLHVRLDGQASADIHTYAAGTILGGVSRQPDGRKIDPLSGAGAFDAAPRTTLLNSLNTLDPNVEWTSFVADLSGGEVSTLKGWSLDIATVPVVSTVPEAGTTVSGILGCAVLAWNCTRRRRRA